MDNVVTPADVFSDLWALVWDDLRTVSAMDAPVSYNARTGAAPEDEAAYVREARCIWLYRDEPLPDPYWEPDTLQPEKDACLLAHEYGHYLSDKAGRAEAYESANDVFIAGGPITEVELALVLDEERLAWSHARSELAKLGVTEWAYFDEQETTGLDAYKRAASPKRAPPSVADSVVVTQAPAIPKWFPLGQDGDWLQEAVWSRNLYLLRDRKDGVRALDALRTYFTPVWSKAHQLDAPSHPVVRHAISIDSRYRLLEVGLMLAEMNQTKRLRQRLLPAREYEGTCAELRGGLLLRAAGAQVEWEPVKTGSGPDWLGRWPGGSLAMEVKRPRTSERAEAQYRVESDFMFEFMRAISDPPLVVDAGIWLTFHPSDAITKLKTSGGSVDMNAVRSLARDAAEGVRTAFPRPVQAGRFSAGHAGDFEIQQGADEPKVHLGMRHIARDHEHDAGRLLGLVQEAAEQLDRVPDVPGLVLIDTEGDFGVLNHRSLLLEALREKPWAKGLAGIALLSQTGTVDDAARELRTDSIVHIVPGHQVRALLDTLIGGLRICNREHFHFDPLLAPTAECTLTW